MNWTEINADSKDGMHADAITGTSKLVGDVYGCRTICGYDDVRAYLWKLPGVLTVLFQDVANCGSTFEL